MQPKRLKLGRYRGWKIGDAKYVGRPSRWAEPKELTGTRAQIVRQYEERIMQMSPDDREKFLAPLRGKDPVCYCEPDEICHADVLLRLANPGPTECTPRQQAQKKKK
jgi:hypothetical protein